MVSAESPTVLEGAVRAQETALAGNEVLVSLPSCLVVVLPVRPL